MQRELVFNLHSIILTIGPSNSGKTYFCQEVLVPQIRALAPKLHVAYISSDDLRQELLGFTDPPAQRYDHMMKDVSEEAFNLLFTKVEALARFPVKAEFIIVDTTGLGEVFRSRIQALADKHHYALSAVLFNYRSYDTHLTGVTDIRGKKIISDQIKRCREKVIREIKPSIYTRIHRIGDRLPKEAYRVTVPKLPDYLATQLDPNLKYIVIGDIHECLDELKSLLEKNRINVRVDDTLEVPANHKIILVGDYVDKGAKTAEIIEFLTLNRQHFILVRGNHEEFTYRHLDSTETIKNEHFTSIHRLRADPVLAAKFRRLYESSLPFVWCRGTYRSSFVVTHAPCSSRFIGKLDSKSLKAQLVSDPSLMNIDRTSPEFIPAIRQLLAKGETPSVYHFFGHFACDRPFRWESNVGLDTGCIGGGKLTSVFVADGDIYFKSQPFMDLQPKGEERINILSMVESTCPDVDVASLEDREVSRLNYIMRNRINYISGTMCPANKSATELESLEEGLNYYRQHKVTHVVLEPKYMGSRCTIYLDRDLSECYATSRNGYKISLIADNQSLEGIYTALLTKFRPLMERDKIIRLVLDGELLPWEALGRKLIQSHFQVIDAALSTELQCLSESGFEDELKKTLTNPEFEEFAKKSSMTKKASLKEQYGDTVITTWSNLLAIRPYIDPLTQHRQSAATYHDQVKLYSQSTPLCFKSFNVLKIIYADGREVLPDIDLDVAQPFGKKTSQMFTSINDDAIVVIDLASPQALEQAQAYYKSLIGTGMEGLVIKPEILTPAERKYVAPYLKVRNPEYLTLIYGYDYRHPRKHSDLMANKSIRKKLQTSIIESNLGYSMLRSRMPLRETEESEYRQLTANMIFETRKEETMDPRL
jgi:hypothetical protein